KICADFANFDYFGVNVFASSRKREKFALILIHPIMRCAE
ncbi:MAG: hypothetical protein ACI90V_000489, partial [Bacillariaceae sp.]